MHYLLTYTAPIDAVTRAAAVLSQQPDPLRPARELQPNIPVGRGCGAAPGARARYRRTPSQRRRDARSAGHRPRYEPPVDGAAARSRAAHSGDPSAGRDDGFALDSRQLPRRSAVSAGRCRSPVGWSRCCWSPPSCCSSTDRLACWCCRLRRRQRPARQRPHRRSRTATLLGSTAPVPTAAPAETVADHPAGDRAGELGRSRSRARGRRACSGPRHRMGSLCGSARGSSAARRSPSWRSRATRCRSALPRVSRAGSRSRPSRR